MFILSIDNQYASDKVIFIMITFFMLGGFSSKRFKGMRPKDTERAERLIEKFGGRIESMYTVLGEKDLVLILSFPGVKQALKASDALSKMTGISFAAVPAIRVQAFDQLMA